MLFHPAFQQNTCVGCILLFQFFFNRLTLTYSSPATRCMVQFSLTFRFITVATWSAILCFRHVFRKGKKYPAHKRPIPVQTSGTDSLVRSLRNCYPFRHRVSPSTDGTQSPLGKAAQGTGDVFRDIKFKNIHIQLPGKPAQRFPCYHHMMVPPVKMHLCLMHFRQDNTVLSATK